MKKLDLASKILIAMVLGVVVGIILNLSINNWGILTTEMYKPLEVYIFSPIGSIFIRAIRMLVVPMVFVSLINGVAQIGDLKKLGRVGGKTLAFYLVTTALAITIGLTLASIIQPGQHITRPSDIIYEAKEAKPFVDIIVDMIPTNPLESMVTGNMLQVIVFSILLGMAITGISKEKSGKLLDLLDATNDAILKIVDFVMQIAPFGVFALLVKVAATEGFQTLQSLLIYMFTVILALVLQVVIVYGGGLMLFSKMNPILFFKKFKTVMSIAFSTSSSNAVLPVTMETVEKNFGVHKSILSFTLPLGATINMDGTAIMQGVATIFIAQVFGVPLPFTALLTVVLTATLASIGTAGVPGVGLITLSMVLASVGLPVEGIAIILGVDRLLDMLRTAVNVTGDAIVTIIVAKSENEVDESILYSSSIHTSSLSIKA